jgi:hypothetical protein
VTRTQGLTTIAVTNVQYTGGDELSYTQVSTCSACTVNKLAVPIVSALHACSVGTRRAAYSLAWRAHFDSACTHWQADNNVRQLVAKIDMEVIPKSKETTTMYTYIMCGGSMPSQQGDAVPTPSPSSPRSVTPTSTPVWPTAAPVSRAPTPAPTVDDSPGKKLLLCSRSC